MSKVEIIFLIIVIVAVALDVIVRLAVVPHRRDKFVENLLDSMIEPESEAVEQISRLPHAAAALDDSLAESLLRHFEHSATSRRILAALASPDGIPESEILSAVNRSVGHLRKRELPAAVVRRVIIILMRADLAALNGDRLELTTAGKRLHALLEVRSTGAMPVPAFVSP